MNRSNKGLSICHRLIAIAIASLGSTAANAQSYSKTEVITYYDDLSKWVLGQPATRTVNGIEESKITYGAASASPERIYSFGKLQQSISYNTDGTVGTTKDGNNNVSYAQDWKRGIPQLVKFPPTPDQLDGSSTSAVVDEFGQIKSIVDTNGYRTCYDYDNMGRLKLTQLPSENTGECGGSWNDTTASFTSGYPAAYGLPAGQWRHRVMTGNALTETLFDALWRPVVKQTYEVNNEAATISQVITRYDDAGRVSFVSYPQRALDPGVTNTWANPAVAPNAKGVTTKYDALGRITETLQDAELPESQLKTTVEYLDGFRRKTTNPRKQVTIESFQVFDTPNYDSPVEVMSPEGVKTTITRDVFGKPVTLVRSGGN